MRIYVVFAFILLAALSPAFAQINVCDVATPYGSVDATDVQRMTNMTIGLLPCTANILGANVCIAAVVQRVINAALGGPCVANPWRSHGVTLTWVASTSDGVAGYNVYRSTISGGPYTKINVSLVAALTYEDTVVQAGQTYYYVVTAVDGSSNESAYSMEARATIPFP